MIDGHVYGRERTVEGQNNTATGYLRLMCPWWWPPELFKFNDAPTKEIGLPWLEVQEQISYNQNHQTQTDPETEEVILLSSWAFKKFTDFR